MTERASTRPHPSARPPHGLVEVAIVGAGVAALAAGLAARAAGAQVRFFGGPRGLSHLASGVWDQGDTQLVPDALRAALTSARKDAQRAVLLALGGYRSIPFSAGDRPLVATAEGTLRRVLSAERNVLDLAPLRSGRIAVVGLPALPVFDPRALARSLDEDAVRRGDPRRFFAIEAEHGRRAHDVLLSMPELARAHDLPRAREHLALALARAVGELPADALLLPPVLGSFGDGVTTYLERALGKAVGEVAAARSIQSERLATKLESRLTELDGARVHGNVDRMVLEPDRITVTAGRAHATARAVVLATGRTFAGGLGRREAARPGPHAPAGVRGGHAGAGPGG